MKKFFQDFQEFIKKGNIIDLAIGIIIGGAFNVIVRSLVNDIIMPLIGLLGGVNIADAKLVLVPAVINTANEIITPAVELRYGAFIQSIIDFLIVSLAIFLTLRVIIALQKRIRKPAEPQQSRENAGK